MAATRLTRPQPEAPFSRADADLIAGAIDRAGFKGTRVVLGAPRELLTCDVLELPPRTSGAPIEQLARIEVARMHRCDPGSFELGLWDLPALRRSGPPRSGRSDTSELTNVFAVAMPHEKAEPLVQALSDAGLDVMAIDAPGLAVARACELESSTPGFRAILDLGYNSALLIVLHGETVIYERSIAEAALSRLFAAVRARIGVDDDAAMLVLSPSRSGPDAPLDQSPANAVRNEARTCLSAHLDALLPEVQRSLSYIAHRYSEGPAVPRLLVSGDGSELAGLRDRLSSALSIAVVPANVGSTIATQGAQGLSGSPTDAFVTAIGLSRYSAPALGRAAA